MTLKLAYCLSHTGECRIFGFVPAHYVWLTFSNLPCVDKLFLRCVDGNDTVLFREVGYA
jgi:hypothetical protein